MAKYVFRRVVYALITFFLIATATFFLMKALPGSPISSASKLSPSQLAIVEAKYGLDQPVAVQYGKYMLNLAKGDLGNSFQFKNASVTDLITNRLGPSFILGSQGLILGVAIGIMLGMIAALRQNTIWDYGSTLIAIIGISIPSFVFATFLQYWLGVKWEIFPVALWKDGWMSSVLPSIALAMGPLATASRFIRTEMIEVLSSDYITLAKSKGASGFEIAFKHAFRNALIPLVTVLGPLAAGLLTGSLVIEQIFAIPGIGEQFVKSIMSNDFSIIMGTTLFFSAFLIVVIFIVDILYGIIDPRIRLSGGNK
ncbi:MULTISPECIES: oligopeptide ABC transporter permease [Bacillaceae]|jgi:oligopeptide transport system permease protein|uniref:oligopeptide ABC transporter permease n=1 Tax=Bacillaceae TaxID=186817 RepID=UPI0006AF2AE6|nr:MULTISPECIES: oligopeptide ABC transporter permease [Bacillaceae]ALC86285.1 peptide ABC transporter permease [Bacillus sp. FJAT-22090]KQL36686.1 peptide ABC transporter permease [Psychrobacillus sp. FJAT-21963]MDF2065744.1 ABC transporter permease [Bacillus sp. Cr_A10]